jgi:hypothetical protein
LLAPTAEMLDQQIQIGKKVTSIKVYCSPLLYQYRPLSNVLEPRCIDGQTFPADRNNISSDNET